MGPKPRSIHLSSAKALTSASTVSSTPAASLTKPPYPSWKPPKAHLARFASLNPAPSGSSASYTPPTAEAGSGSSSRFTPPLAPKLPARRRPAFNPGGFGMQSAPLPAPGFGSSSRNGKGKDKDVGGGKVLTEIERRTEEIRREEMMQEGREVKEGQEEAEACYVVPYETWGRLNPDKSNAILLHTGLSASSHVASKGNDVASTTANKPGWWEDFVGPGKSIDTDKYFVICTNTLGGCFGSTGPSSPLPGGESNVRWATRFPLLSIHDMTRGQLHLLDHLGIDRLYASVGASMGGMQSLSLAYLAPERVGRVASISACGRAGLGGVGMRYAQRSVLMADPNWNRGFYYDGIPPHSGMKLARQIATITYRSGPEWEQRFARRMLSEKEGDVPRLSPDFLIETYLDHQGERFCLTYDANSMIYLSKAMDLFDLTSPALKALAERYESAYPDGPAFPYPSDPITVSAASTSCTTPPSDRASQAEQEKIAKRNEKFIPTSKSTHLKELAEGLQRLRNIPALVLGVQSDILFPVEQQRELADALKMAGNEKVTYYELGGVWGHDTFLLDVQNVGAAIRGFLH